MSFEFEKSIVIDRPVEDVFEYVTTLENHEEWIDPVLVTHSVDEELAVGTTWTRTVEFIGKTELVMECPDFDPPNRFGYRTVSGFVGDRLGGRDVFTFADEGQKTRLTRSVTVEVQGFMRPFQALLKPMISKRSTRLHENLKSILEANEE